MQLIISLTNACNLNCKHCIVDKLFKSSLPIDAIEKIASTFDVSSVGIIGGEPFIRNDLDRIIDLFGNKPITIYTNGIVLRKNPEKTITGDNINYAVSLDGMRRFHDYYRGAGTWIKTVETIRNLAREKERDNIKSVWIRMTISNKNKRDIIMVKKIADKLNIGVMYFPFLGIREPFSIKFQLNLFRWAVKYDNVSIYSPQFWQFCGYKESTCQAGKYRLHVDENGNVNPCQWLRETILGNVYSNEYDYFVEKGLEYHKENIKIKNECKYCIRRFSCKGGCRLSPDSMTCPVGRRLFAENVLDIDSLRIAENKYERTFKNLKIVGC